MKAEAFRDLSTGELGDRVLELREQMLKLRFQKSTGQIENPQKLRGLRRDVARVMTLLRERELKVAATAPAEKPATAQTGEGSAPQDDE